MHLLLWDIDGTLINARGAGRDSMMAAARDVFGVNVAWSRMDHVGRTDKFICRCMAELHGIAFDPVRLDAFICRYTELLEQTLRQAVPPEPLPGARALLDAAHGRPDVVQGLLTGNFREAAFIKLRHFGLEGYFDFGAYGDESEDRSDIARLAFERACAHAGREPAQVVVIGDTAHDASCGRSLGARVVLVATGVTGVAGLRAFQPDLLLPDLSALHGRLELLWELGGVDPEVPPLVQ